MGWGRVVGGVVKPSPHPLVSDGRNPKVMNEASEEAQALLVLRRWQEMPGLGIQLVPEHVETRPLYHPRSPGLLQVKGLGPPKIHQDPHLTLDPFPKSSAHTLLPPPLAPGVCKHPAQPWSLEPVCHGLHTPSLILSYRIPNPEPTRLRPRAPSWVIWASRTPYTTRFQFSYSETLSWTQTLP